MDDLQTIVMMNTKGEAWWEVFLWPSMGLLIFLGLFLELRRWRKQ